MEYENPTAGKKITLDGFLCPTCGSERKNIHISPCRYSYLYALFNGLIDGKIPSVLEGMEYNALRTLGQVYANRKESGAGTICPPDAKTYCEQGNLMAEYGVESIVRAIESEYEEVKETIEGEPDVVSIVSGGVKHEGQILPCFATSERDALRLLVDSYRKYRDLRRGRILVWRCKPEVREITAYSFLKGEAHHYVFPLFNSNIPVTIDADLAYPHSLYSARMRLAIRD